MSVDFHKSSSTAVRDAVSVQAVPGSAGTPAAAPQRGTRTLSVIDSRALERACLVHCLAQLADHLPVTGFDSVTDWQATPRDRRPNEVILLHVETGPALTDAAREALAALVRQAAPAPVIVLATTEDLDSMITALDCGAVGYFYPNVKLDELVEAVCVSATGGILLPRESLRSLRQAVAGRPAAKNEAEAQFTDRQLAVARALQRGKANKTIAYELNLAESTVKVHIRKIMRTLQATNRTQAAYKLNAMLGTPT